MSTLDPGSAHLIADLLQNKGIFEDDPPYVRIYRYLRIDTVEPEFGEDWELYHYAVFTNPNYDDMIVSPFVKYFELLMQDGMITLYGVTWLTEYEKRIKRG